VLKRLVVLDHVRQLQASTLVHLSERNEGAAVLLDTAAVVAMVTVIATTTVVEAATTAVVVAAADATTTRVIGMMIDAVVGVTTATVVSTMTVDTMITRHDARMEALQGTATRILLGTRDQGMSIAMTMHAALAMTATGTIDDKAAGLLFFDLSTCSFPFPPDSPRRYPFS
jgi:hypothetical protein